jgi:Ni/Fe-hydrogenase 1 B-type cytochrome subunit
MEKLVAKYVWEWPVRITHWVNFLAILILSVTGIYIGSPKTLALNPSQFVMGWVRFVHFVVGYIFSISVLSRIYWMFKGNKYANWRVFVPYLFKEGRENMKGTFLFYIFARSKAPPSVGHNGMAGATYLWIFFLYLVMMFTGFALYSEHAPHSLIHNTFGWMFSLMTNQGIRLTHHLVMWLLIAFAIHHVYSGWLMDVKEKNGVMSSIFGGWKSVPAEDEH